MRFMTYTGLSAAALVLTGCVATTPLPGAVPPAPVAPAAPTVLDAASREVARNVINSEMQKRIPGANVAPYTDCVINNATTAELIDIAQASRAGIGGTANSVAAIVTRPGATQCIKNAAQTA